MDNIQKKQREIDLSDLTVHLRRKQFERFHGDIVIKYRDGKIQLVEEKKTFRFANEIG
jgi:hypothetical protein